MLGAEGSFREEPEERLIGACSGSHPSVLQHPLSTLLHLFLALEG